MTTPEQKRRLFRGVDPRPIRLERCWDCRCRVFIPPWRIGCWRHETRVEVLR